MIMKALLYCTKVKPYLLDYKPYCFVTTDKTTGALNGKIVAECDIDTEEIIIMGEPRWYPDLPITKTLTAPELEKKSCLDRCTLLDYLNGKNGYALHISNLNVFDKPKGLYEYGVRKAPQNMCRVYKDNHFYVLISIRPEWLCKILNGEKTVEVRKQVLKKMRW